MLQHARLLRRIVCSRSCSSTIQARSYGSKRDAGSFDKKTRKIIDEIKDLEYRLEASKKREETLSRLAELSERDAEAVYAELTAPPPPRLTKVGPDYLERLRVKFLDTRPLQLDDPRSVKALPGAEGIENENGNWQDALQIIEKSPNTLLVASDYEQLIYANALARRPREAERVLELMKENGIEPSLRAYNHVVDAYANAQDLDGALEVYKRIKQLGLQPDLYTYGILIKAFVQHSRLSEAFVIFEQLKKSELIPDQIIFSTLIAGCIKAGEIDKAWDLFDAMRLSYHQPDEVTFTMMIQACAKRGEVERALNMFEDMTGNSLYPTDVTFNALISACAKRPDYYETAFELFEQMHTVYNFEPDTITYNILLGACARKRELKRARQIVQTMQASSSQQQHDSMISPDEHTFITLFSCYANYNPPSPKKSAEAPAAATTEDDEPSALVEHSLFPPSLPIRRSQVVQEAKHVFNYIVSNKLCDVSSDLLTAYLDVHVTQKQWTECLDIYEHEFAKYNIERLPKTFSHMLRYAYDTRDSTLAWKIWEDYQEFLESRLARFPDPGDNIVERKRLQDEMTACQRKENWTLAHQRNMLLSMANTLGRGNDIKNAIKLLQTYFPNGKEATMQWFKLSELKPLYDKCIQLEDQDSRDALKRLCVPDRRTRPADWRFRKQ